ncbi:MAG TPA: Hsp70 family protein [Vicinamibacterales bacterium]|nr:Hsp70 family protein [Vicinamibacterales bacterium]
MAQALGIDFGTTNSAVALIDGTGTPQLAAFQTPAGPTTTFRSILYFDPKPIRGQESVFAGPQAVEHYRQAQHKGRFLQSLKAYLGDAGFTGTTIGGRHRSLPQLIALIVQRLLRSAADTLGPLPARAIVGRPVHFTVARSDEHDALALARLREALEMAGVTDPVFEYEPIAAAYAYQQRLTSSSTVLIGDFGGGTSDFSILALEPPSATAGHGVIILGNDGVAVAGDAFDRAIVRHAVAPQLGKGSDYLSPPDKVLPMPEWVYSRLERWHHLSFLKSGETLDMLRRIQRTSTARHGVAALLHLVEEDLGYELHERVNATKITLSSALEAELRFDLEQLEVQWHATRAQFERWLHRDLQVIERCISQMLARSGVAAGAVETVFLTGGTSFVPAVRAIFARLFPEAAITGGHELTSVATGLALRAKLSNW